MNALIQFDEGCGNEDRKDFPKGCLRKFGPHGVDALKKIRDACSSIDGNHDLSKQAAELEAMANRLISAGDQLGKAAGIDVHDLVKLVGAYFLMIRNIPDSMASEAHNVLDGFCEFMLDLES